MSSSSVIRRLYGPALFSRKKVWTVRGLVDVFVLFFIHLGSRRIHLASITANPERAWMVQQARNMVLIFD